MCVTIFRRRKVRVTCRLNALSEMHPKEKSSISIQIISGSRRTGFRRLPFLLRIKYATHIEVYTNVGAQHLHGAIALTPPSELRTRSIIDRSGCARTLTRELIARKFVAKSWQRRHGCKV